MKFAIFLTVLLTASPLPEVFAGPLAYGICQTGCNAVVVACYAAAGFTFGTGENPKVFYPIKVYYYLISSVTAGAGVPAVIIGCNAGLGKESIQ